MFAQAREKARQTSCASQFKQVSLAILQYVQDYDECFPAGQINAPGIVGAWSNGFVGWQYPCSANQLDCLEWGSSTQPYIKNDQVFACPSAAGDWNFYNYVENTKPKFTYTFNGDLQFSPQSVVVQPASTILVWPGFLKNTWVGRNWAMPLLDCPDGNQECVYKPSANGACDTKNGGKDNLIVYGGYPTYTKWAHGNGDNFAYIDGHVKWVPLRGDWQRDPWSVTGTDGGIISNGTYGFWTDGCHNCLFAPDNPCGVP